VTVSNMHGSIFVYGRKEKEEEEENDLVVRQLSDSVLHDAFLHH